MNLPSKRRGQSAAGRWSGTSSVPDVGRASYWATTRGRWRETSVRQDVTFSEAKARRRPSQVLVWHGPGNYPAYVASAAAILDRFMAQANPPIAPAVAGARKGQEKGVPREDALSPSTLRDIRQAHAGLTEFR